MVAARDPFPLSSDTKNPVAALITPPTFRFQRFDLEFGIWNEVNPEPPGTPHPR